MIIELPEKGWVGKQIHDLLMKVKFDSTIYIMVDTLKYLKQGGRITPAAAALGGMLRLKPILLIKGEKLDKFKMRNTSVDKAKDLMIQAAKGCVEGYLKDIDGIIYNINFYFTNTDILYLILQFFYFLFYGALLHVLSLLAVHYFTPNYVVVCNELVGIANVIIQSKNLNKWVSLFLFVLIILSLSFYLEILEYNFCGLNQNTKKNIQERIEKQNEAKEIEESVKKDIVDLPFGYTINMEKSNKEIEMRTFSEEVLGEENKESEYDSNIEEGDMKNEKLSYKNDT